MKAEAQKHDRLKADASIAEQEESPLVWSARWSLTTRILAVNILAIALLAGGFYYLDTYRSRLVDTRIEVMKDQLAMLDSALEAARPDQRATLIREFTAATESRLRFYGADGRRVSDSFASGPSLASRPSSWRTASSISADVPRFSATSARVSTVSLPIITLVIRFAFPCPAPPSAYLCNASRANGLARICMGADVSADSEIPAALARAEAEVKRLTWRSAACATSA